MKATGVIAQSQIHSAFVSLIIDGVEYGTLSPEGPQSITQFVCTKTTNQRSPAGISFRITLNYLLRLDFYERILKLIKQSPTGLVMAKIQYGYYDGLVSPIYESQLKSCKPTDLWQNLELTFYTEAATNSKDRYHSWTEATKELIESRPDGYYTSLSQLVTDIAKGQSWFYEAEGGIIPTKDNYQLYDNKRPPVDFALSNPLEAINSMIREFQPISLNDETNYYAAFKYRIGQEPIFYFVPTQDLKADYRWVDTADTYEFFFNALPQGKVIKFNPTLTTAINELAGEGVLSFNNKPNLGVITSDSRELTSILFQMEDKPNVKSYSEPESFAGYINLKSAVGNGQPVQIASPDVENYMKATISGNFSQYVNTLGVRNTATMSIIGDPSLNVMDHITVIPYYPITMDDIVSGLSGKIHPSGGVYWIQQIEDTISNGGFTTNLELKAESNRDFTLGKITAITTGLSSFQEVKEEKNNAEESPQQATSTDKVSEAIKKAKEASESQQATILTK